MSTYEAANNPGVLSADAVGVIGADTVDVTAQFGTDISSLVPTIAITGMSVNPASGTAQAFIDGVGETYTVAAEDSSTKDYTVTVNPNDA